MIIRHGSSDFRVGWIGECVTVSEGLIYSSIEMC